MAKIYRRDNLVSGVTPKKKNEKNRKRSVIVNFRVTPEEKQLIDERIALSGLPRAEFFIQSCMYQKVITFCFTQPQPEDVFFSVYIVSQNDIDCVIPGFIILTDRDIQAVHKQKRIEFFQRPVLPFVKLFQAAVGDLGYGIMRDLKTIDILDCFRDIPLAHPFYIHSQHLVLDRRYITFRFRDDHGFKRSIAVTWHLDRYVPCRRF